jgi:hypothetical protein
MIYVHGGSNLADTTNNHERKGLHNKIGMFRYMPESMSDEELGRLPSLERLKSLEHLCVMYQRRVCNI